MKKYLIIAVIGLVAVAAVALKYFPDSYSYEIKTDKSSVLSSADSTPEVKKADDEKGLKPINIILAPHFGGAVLSLGGFLAKDQAETEVDTFFAGKPPKDLYVEWDKISGFYDSDEASGMRKIENKKALGEFGAEGKNYDYLDFRYREKDGSTALTAGQIERSIEKDIESIISRYPSREIYIYASAAFKDKIISPDHEILYKAFMAEAGKNKSPNVHFLIYEDLTYVREFAQSDLGSLEDRSEAENNIKLEKNAIEINQDELAKKAKGTGDYVSEVTAFKEQNTDIVSSIQNFGRKRCKADHPDWYACEVVYEVRF